MGWAGWTIVTALVYAASGKLALLMAISPGYSTAVWPASGLALALVLVSKYRALPGVFLGSLAVVLPEPIAVGVAAGAALQAWLGAYLIQRTVGYPNSLDDARDINRFLFLGGPLACLVSATAGVSMLSATSLIPIEEVAFNWLTWWVGDTIGVLIFAPLGLAFLGEPREAWRRRRARLAVPLAIGFALVVFLFWRASAWEQERLHTDFQLEVAPLANRLETTLSRYRDAAVAVSSLFDASEHVTEKEFAAFAQRSLADHPGLLSLSFLGWVEDADRAAVEGEYFPITEITATGSIALARKRPFYAPVLYAVSRSVDLRRAHGIDMLSEETRKEALERARELRKPAISGRLDFVVDAVRRAGAVLAVPLFDDHAEKIDGYALASFRIEEIMEEAFAGFNHSSFEIELLDLSPSAERHDLYLHRPREETRSAAASRFDFEHLVPFGNRNWKLHVSATNDYAEAHRSWSAWFVLAGGLFVVGMLGVTLLLGTGREIRIAAAEAKYRDLYENSPDLYASIDRTTLAVLDCNRTLVFTLGYERSEIIGRSILEFHEPASQPRVEALFRSLSTGENLRDTELTLLKKDQSLIEASLAVAANRCVWRDITARKVAEKGERSLLAALQQLNEQLEARVEARTAELSGALREKEVLIKEVHHRVKNNLQVISSLLSLQGHHLPDEKSRDMFLQSQARVHSIALVHESLYGARDLSHVDFQHYAEALIQNLMYTHDASSRRITFSIDAGGVRLPVDEAIPCGLIMNELVMNSLKHAFPRGRSGKIWASLENVQNTRVRFSVSDDGIGIGEKDLAQSSSLGLELVYTFAEQLRAEVTVERAAGTTFQFEFERDA